MKVENLPQDVLLELAKRQNLRDLFGFLSTCHVIRQIRFQRSLWLGALVRLKEIELQPLPHSTADPLETLSLPELQNVARRADRLKRNWQSNAPRLIYMRSFSLASRARIMFIPGAHLALAYGSDFISCWDILSSHQVAHLEIPGLMVQGEAFCMDINGKALIGASISRFTNLAVVCVDFRDRAHISISHAVSPATTVTYSYPTGFFIDPRGMVFIDRTKIVFWCMNPNVAVQTQSMPQSVKETSLTQCLSLGRSIYIRGYTHNWTGIVQIIPHPVSNSDRTVIHPASSTVPLGIPNDPRVWTSSTERPPWIFAPHYGIFTVASRFFSKTRVAVALYRAMIYFCPGRMIHDEIEFGEVCVYEHHGSVSHMAVGTSGTYVALLFARRPPPDPEIYLGLVHCDVTATPGPQTTFRMLDAGDMDLSSCVQLALDDALGLVSLVDREGEVTILSYV